MNWCGNCYLPSYRLGGFGFSFFFFFFFFFLYYHLGSPNTVFD